MREFFRSSLSDKRLIFQALALVCAFRAALWILPYRFIRGFISRKTVESNSHQFDFVLINKLASSVRRTSRYVPAASCLTQALATLVLLGRYGETGVLRIGVARNTRGEFKAHAWVECDGKIVIGKAKDLSSFTVLALPDRSVVRI